MLCLAESKTLLAGRSVSGQPVAGGASGRGCRSLCLTALQTGTLVCPVHGKNTQPALQTHGFYTCEPRDIWEMKSRVVTM